MDQPTNYALVEGGIVTNIIWLRPSNTSDFPNTVRLDALPVEIGDTYADGAFTRGGEPVLTAEEPPEEVQPTD